MGTLASHLEPHTCLARFKDGTVYEGNTARVIGTYANGIICDEKGRQIASYTDDAVYPHDQKSFPMTFRDGRIYLNDKVVFALYQGNGLEACCAAILHSERNRLDENPRLDNPAWNFQMLWENVVISSPAVVKVFLGIFATVLVVLAVIALPIIASLLDYGLFGFITLGAYLIAFLISFFRREYPEISSLGEFGSLLWQHMRPFVHVTWIYALCICIYTIIRGYFTFSGLSEFLLALPEIAFPLTGLFYSLAMIRCFYLLKRYKK